MKIQNLVLKNVFFFFEKSWLAKKPPCKNDFCHFCKVLKNLVLFWLKWVPGNFNTTIITNWTQKRRKKFGHIPTTFTPLFDPSVFECDRKNNVRKSTKKWLKINNKCGIKFDKNWWKFGKLCAILIAIGFRWCKWTK